jgi:nicotinate-nucleotide pyrophosphorylase (carboxylating)
VTVSLPAGALALVVRAALDEDLGAEGDPTSRLLGARAAAQLVARDPGVVAGLPAVDAVLIEVRERLGLGPAAFRPEAADGAPVEAGAVLGRFAGPARVLLAAERTMLNLLGHLSGVATLTAAFVEAVAGTGAAVRDTRKTTPGLRHLEKYAVRCGGGVNHRMGLYDALLVKDNHIEAAGGLRRAVEAARAAGPGLPLEVEVESLDQVEEALDLGCDLLLLDNMGLEEMAEVVARSKGRARTEASGRITLDRARAVAETGIDFLAVGALTHSAPALDIGLDWERGVGAAPARPGGEPPWPPGPEEGS